MKFRLLFPVLILILAGSISAQAVMPAPGTIRQLFVATAPPGYSTDRSSVGWSPDHRLIAIRFDMLDDRQSNLHSLWYVYEVKTGKYRFVCSELLGWSRDGSRVLVKLTESSPTVMLNLQTYQVDFELPVADEFTGNASTSFSDVIIGMDHDTLHFYDATNGLLKFSLSSVFGNLHFSPDQHYFAVEIRNGDDGGIQVYDTRDYTLAYRLDGYLLRYPYGNWSMDSKQLTVTSINGFHDFLGPFYVWTLAGGLSSPIYNATSNVIWSPDSTRIVVATDFRKVRIYDAERGDLQQTIRGYSEGSTYFWGWDGHYLVAASGDHRAGYGTELTVWDLNLGRFVVKIGVDPGWKYWIKNDEMVIIDPFYSGIKRISLKTGIVAHIANLDSPLYSISPDHRLIATLPTMDETAASVDIYRFDSQKLLATLEGLNTLPDWSPDSIHFATSDGVDNVIVWEIAPDLMSSQG